MRFLLKSGFIALGLWLAVITGASGALEKAELITGTQWTKWSGQDKLIYIRGMGNLADFIAGAQAQSQKKPTWEFSVSKVLVDELKEKSLGQIAADVDAYYQENPQKMNTSVIEAVLRRCTKVCPPESGAMEKRK
jgi:hypothetical protein